MRPVQRQSDSQLDSLQPLTENDHPRQHQHQHHHEHEHEHEHSACCASAPPEFPDLAAQRLAADGTQRTMLRIMQLDCPSEEALLRASLSGMTAVHSLEFDLLQRTLTVAHEPEQLGAILAAIRSLDFAPEQAGASGQLAAAQEPVKPWWPLALAGLAAFTAELTSWLGGPNWLTALLALAAIALCGLGIYRKAWLALRCHTLNINALMSIAVTGALLLGQWPEAAMVMVLFALAELLEAKSLTRARYAITGLLARAPEQARVRQMDDSWQLQPIQSVAIGAMVRVQPGERIALDGTIVAGSSSIDQATITGESLPVDKVVGDSVFAGTLNQTGSFDIATSASAQHSTLARVTQAVQQAQGAKAPTQRFVDSFAKIYTPVVIVLAFSVALLLPVVFGFGWYESIYKALVLLVIACPCALVISTPVTIVSGLATAARMGILIKGGVYLEQGRKLATLALDKTGTITHGKPIQTDFEVTAELDATACRPLAAALAMQSDHPVSRALADAAHADRITVDTIEQFQALPGFGVAGVINGSQYALGSRRLAQERGIDLSAWNARFTKLEQCGKTLVLLLDAHRLLAYFAVADTVKESSRSALAELHQLGINSIMLSGDNLHTALAIAQQVGIEHVYAEQLPQQKQAQIEALCARGMVGMVGDGLNDAPALASADIGFAMAALGSDTAIETADVALMDDDLRKIPAFVLLSRRTHAVLVQNIVIALGMKLVFLVFAMIGIGTMWMAVFADVGASLLVVANGLRLLQSRKYSGKNSADRRNGNATIITPSQLPSA